MYFLLYFSLHFHCTFTVLFPVLRKFISGTVNTNGRNFFGPLCEKYGKESFRAILLPLKLAPFPDVLQAKFPNYTDTCTVSDFTSGTVSLQFECNFTLCFTVFALYSFTVLFTLLSLYLSLYFKSSLAVLYTLP